MNAETLWLLASNALEAGTTLTLDPKDVLETVVEFNAEIAELWSQIDGLHEEAAAQEAFITDLDNKVDAAENAAELAQDDLRDLENQVWDLEGQLRDSEAERARLEDQLEEALAELEEFENNG